MSSSTLYVSDVDGSITDDQLYEIFSRFGRVNHATIKKSIRGTNDFFYAFIEFEQYDDALNALKEMHQKELFGKRISIKFAKTRDSRSFNQSRQFYGDFKSSRENKFEVYRHSPRDRSQSRERKMGDMYSYPSSGERMYSREQPVNRFNSREDNPPRDIPFEGKIRIYRDRFERMKYDDGNHFQSGTLTSQTNPNGSSPINQESMGTTTPSTTINNTPSAQTSSSGPGNGSTGSYNNSFNSHTGGRDMYQRREFDYPSRDSTYQRRDDRYMSRDDYPMDRSYDSRYEGRGNYGRGQRGYDSSDRGYSGDRMKPSYGRRDEMRDSHYSGRGGYHQY